MGPSPLTNTKPLIMVALNVAVLDCPTESVTKTEMTAVPETSASAERTETPYRRILCKLVVPAAVGAVIKILLLGMSLVSEELAETVRFLSCGSQDVNKVVGEAAAAAALTSAIAEITGGRLTW